MCGIALVADARGRRSHDTVGEALDALVRLTHRGAPAETASIDGSGILTQIPWEVLADDLPAAFADERTPRALGMFFLPRGRVSALKDLIAEEMHLAGFGGCCWRTVPVSFEPFDARRTAGFPAIVQLATIAGSSVPDIERALYSARQRIEAATLSDVKAGFALVSLSSRTVVYKGLLTPAELARFYPDLRDPNFRSAIAIVHQRFSTNTGVRWGLAQPFQVLAHNGEIATAEGNRRSTGARLRESGLATQLGTPADQWASDSQSLDVAAQAIMAGGCELPLALARLVPPAWENDAELDPAVAAFYEYESAHAEPWDGPAAIAFSDGVIAGALLDRNGFRPARYVRTREDRVYLGSEAGIFDIPGGAVVERGRLGPGGMLIVDTRTGEVLDTAASRKRLASARPYRALVAKAIVPLESIAPFPAPRGSDADGVRVRQRLFGCSQEEIETILRPMGRDSAEAIGSMGDDAPLAHLSRFNRLLPDYFRQRFAQVTNPAMDPLRERCVMSLRVLLGASPSLALPSPILNPEGFEQVSGTPFLRPVTMPLMFNAGDGVAGLERAVTRLADNVAHVASNGVSTVILSDRGAGPTRLPIPPLLAVAAVHERLLAAGVRSRTSIVVESGEARDAHQIATLCAFGASAVFPWLGFETQEALGGETFARSYKSALEHGLLKILSKMGVSTIAGYRGSALFDIVGLDATTARRWFPAAQAASLGGATLAHIAEAAAERHRAAYTEGGATSYPGFHSFRRGGEQHAYDPAVVRQLHKAVSGEEGAYRAFTTLVDGRPPMAIRDLLAWKTQAPIALERVEPEQKILRRFFSAAMSVGALAPEAHEVLAIAMNRLGGRSNSGEGGESPERYGRRGLRDSRGSAIKQVASARFGVTPAYLRSAEELQIKIAQGSKPGEGGQLPAIKVVEHIAVLRHAQPGMTLISPPVHHDIYSIEDLAQLIFDLRRFHPAARVSVKLVSSAGVGVVAAGAAKAGADVILISGYEGGTGASPRSSIKHAGLPWEIGLAEAHRTLIRHGLRKRVVLQVDGGLQRGRDVMVAAALGADEFGFGTAALVAIGCVMARQCHLDTCPAGIATQRPDLRARFKGTPEMAATYFQMLAADVRQTLADLGLVSLDDLVGRVELLRERPPAAPHAFDLLALLSPAVEQAPPRPARPTARSNQPDDVDLPDALGSGGSLVVRSSVRNVDRAVGASLAGRITERFGAEGLAPGSVVMQLTGTAGQSLGAFLVPGLDIHLTGEANDYIGKGMHGGTIAIQGSDADHDPRTDTLGGNAILYGATGGHLFVRGAVGERFAVRNSGAVAVVEGIGDHGCEYMTGGTVVNLGTTGRNFASGMTGGTAYFHTGGSGRSQVTGEELDEQDWRLLQSLLTRHWQLTGSTRAAALLGQPFESARCFRKISPALPQPSPGMFARSAGTRPLPLPSPV
jgi:glutamate synthase (ferredoxin)